MILDDNNEQRAANNLSGESNRSFGSIPVMEESINVSKETIESGKVYITKKNHAEEVRFDVPVIEEQVQVKHVPVNQYVTDRPVVRYEGDTMIIPVVREVVFIEKRLELVEELHVTKRSIEKQSPQEVTLNREEVIVERTSGSNL